MELQLYETFNTFINGRKMSSIENSENLELVQILLKKGFLDLNTQHQTIYQTTKGIDVYASFCECCECTPCDCNWGN